MKNKTKTLLLSIMSATLLLNGCATSSNTQTIKTDIKNVRKVIPTNDTVESKVVAPKALKATFYPYSTDSGSYIDKHSVYYFVSLPKFKGRETVVERKVDSKIVDFLSKEN